MIRVTVNGDVVELEGPMMLPDFLKARGISSAAIAIDHNGTVLFRHEHDGSRLEDGDTLEIVRMVGGG